MLITIVEVSPRTWIHKPCVHQGHPHNTEGMSPSPWSTLPPFKSGKPLASRRYRDLHPGHLSARSSRGHVLAHNQHSIGSSQGHPHTKSEGILSPSPQSLVHCVNQGYPSQSRKYRALHPGQLSARYKSGRSLHLINTPIRSA